MDIFDTHAHLLDEHFDEDREALIASLSDAGVKLVMEACTDLKYLEKLIPFVEAWPMIYGAAGLHPEELGPYTLSDLTAVEAALDHPKIKAVGEIGLDYYWDTPDREIQKHWFEAQLEMARQAGLPVVVHSRDAAQDTLRIMKEHRAGEIGGVVHCFSYSLEMAREFVEMGFFIGIGGVVTFKNAKKLKEVAAQIPMDHIVLETDSPYLAPVPFRGKRNSSLNLPYIAEAVAQLRGMETEEVALRTAQNARRLYRLA